MAPSTRGISQRPYMRLHRRRPRSVPHGKYAQATTRIHTSTPRSTKRGAGTAQTRRQIPVTQKAVAPRQRSLTPRRVETPRRPRPNPTRHRLRTRSPRALTCQLCRPRHQPRRRQLRLSPCLFVRPLTSLRPDRRRPARACGGASEARRPTPRRACGREPRSSAPCSGAARRAETACPKHARQPRRGGRGPTRHAWLPCLSRAAALRIAPARSCTLRPRFQTPV
ncbi:hypothetical protein BC834DRAFT_18980 [Gloeopeniophorella convolvens]|nr:hypothetical protein BC834DRAFT_18980 [Gloeopeniophorella convolvens]